MKELKAELTHDLTADTELESTLAAAEVDYEASKKKMDELRERKKQQAHGGGPVSTHEVSAAQYPSSAAAAPRSRSRSPPPPPRALPPSLPLSAQVRPCCI